MKRFSMTTFLMAVALVASGCSRSPDPIRVGAIYPLSGSQGPGGVDEYRGVRLAADLVNADGGVRGRAIELEPVDVIGPDAAKPAVAMLASRGIRFVLGSYGSTISSPAGTEANRRGMLFWETGAVGSMPGPGGGRLFFRLPPSGGVLGGAAISFVADQLAPLMDRSPHGLRFAVANVDDLYGNTVAGGAIRELQARGLRLVGRFSYPPVRPDIAGVITGVAATKPDVLFVAAYLEDGIALRTETVRQGLHLLATIGTSSSYCMPAFGAALGASAVGVFASDKPDTQVLNAGGLEPAARSLLGRADTAYRQRFHQGMSAAALAGFSAAWALFRTVMPAAGSMTPAAVAAAALEARIPVGGLPNGSGLELAGPGGADPGANLLASSVIEEWVGVNTRATVWPPRFATTSIRALPLDP